jgi:cell division protein ZapA (FtsZ GTPase activity inhibitor)
MKEDTLLINVQIGGFRIPLRVPRSDEEIYRRAQKMVNDNIDSYQKRFTRHSYEEILIMVAFHLSATISRHQLSGDLSPVEEALKALEAEIDNALNQE